MRGEIYNLNAYTKAKLINHSGWTEHLPRFITPSDIDYSITTGSISASVDSNGKICMMEYSSKFSSWSDLSKGQHLHYKRYVEIGQGRIFAILCHNVTLPDCQIDSIKDIKAFQIMFYKNGKICYTAVYDGVNLPAAVKHLLNAKL